MSGMEDILEISMEQLLLENQTAIYGLAENFPVPVIGPLISTLCFPLGEHSHFLHSFLSPLTRLPNKHL